ncbi:Cytochrome P450 [Mycena sanguinolenta]|uniref:Cytochrome P450 n=1 Tax=Mycena sanguinolenta TaxID=230812 RepID=A0A8H6ZH96_9AGAR|nr:Cytochrome P450 [Mycena sanguinolenta]
MHGSLATIILVATIYVVHRLSCTPSPAKLPPGPYRWPLFGSLLQIPRRYQWLKFSEWAKTYGNLVYLNGFGQSIVIINSAKVARELLDYRSSIYSNRPKFVSEPIWHVLGPL